MNLKYLFIILNVFNLTAVIIVIFIIIEYKQAYFDMEQAYISKNKSFLLADELRQSSDDLTRLVRTYVITTEPRFKAQYYQILAIRNGLYPRPSHYNHIYWDFLAVKGSTDINHPQEKAIALQELMIQAGFTQKELSLLKTSQYKSDSLVRLEEKAMQAVDGIFEDEQGLYTITKEPDLVLARELLHSDEYHKAKVKIMEPLDQFFKLLESRTDRIILEAKNHVNQVKEILDLMVFILIIILMTSMGIMFHRILYPLISLKRSMLQLAKNDTSIVIPQKQYNDEIGGMIHAIEVFKDNTERLIVSEQKVKLLFDAMGEGFFGLNTKGVFSFVNPVACEILGYDSSELLGLHFYKMFKNQVTPSKMSKLLLNNMSAKSTGVIELERKDGTFFPAEYTSTPIFDHEYNIEGSVIIFSDSTQRKKDNDALKLAKETAEAANYSKTLFLANMSHELRTPLNAILGFSRLLLKGSNLDQTQKDNLTTIHKSGKHLLSIISEILEVAKLQAGKIEIANTAFDLHGFLDNIVLIFINRAQVKNLIFSHDDYTILPRFIVCDEQRLRQILFNLLGNAIKFTEHGTIHLSVSFENKQLFCKVHDTGPGIKEEDILLIFKPFEQVKSSPNQHQGTGLGLAITQELISLMHGKINVESKVNKGTTFSFCISAYETIISDTPKNRNELNVVHSLASPKKKVLVVDDIVENRSLLIQMLQHLGFITFEANDGYHALEQLKLCQPDIIFMDIQMPGMDGFKTVDKIRSGTDSPNIPIVLVSANVFEENRQKALDEGANAFIEKPINEEDVISVLNTLLNVVFVNDDSQTKQASISNPITTPLNSEQLENILNSAKVLNNQELNMLFDTYKSLDTTTISFMQEQLYNYDFSSIMDLCKKLLDSK